MAFVLIASTTPGFVSATVDFRIITKCQRVDVMVISLVKRLVGGFASYPKVYEVFSFGWKLSRPEIERVTTGTGRRQYHLPQGVSSETNSLEELASRKLVKQVMITDDTIQNMRWLFPKTI